MLCMISFKPTTNVAKGLWYIHFTANVISKHTTHIENGMLLRHLWAMRNWLQAGNLGKAVLRIMPAQTFIRFINQLQERTYESAFFLLNTAVGRETILATGVCFQNCDADIHKLLTPNGEHALYWCMVYLMISYKHVQFWGICQYCKWNICTLIECNYDMWKYYNLELLSWHIRDMSSWIHFLYDSLLVCGIDF